MTYFSQPIFNRDNTGIGSGYLPGAEVLTGNFSLLLGIRLHAVHFKGYCHQSGKMLISSSYFEFVLFLIITDSLFFLLLLPPCKPVIVMYSLVAWTLDVDVEILREGLANSSAKN